MLLETGAKAGKSKPLGFCSNPCQTGGSLSAHWVLQSVQQARAEGLGTEEERRSTST